MPALYGAMIPDSYFPYSFSKSYLLIAITLIVQLKQSKRDRQNKLFFILFFKPTYFLQLHTKNKKRKDILGNDDYLIIYLQQNEKLQNLNIMKISFSKHTKERAFKQLYEEYYAPFCLYAKRFVDDKETREDIVSDVFTSLWDKLDTDSFDLQSETALGYIKMCVKNSCLNFLKHQEYEWSYAETIQKKAPLYETESDSVYTLDELYRMLYDTLNKLPENYRTVFHKSFFEGKTHAEIAEEMNLSVKSINRYKQKTMELLRNELKDYLPLLLFFLSPEM